MTTTVDKFTASDVASSLFFLSFQMEQHQGLYQVGDKVVYKEKKNSKNLPWKHYNVFDLLPLLIVLSSW